MQKRSLFLTLAAGVLVWGFGALEARAGLVTLPTTLDTLLGAGDYTTNGGLTFSSFSYVADAPPAASAVTVAAFNAGPETGLTFIGGFTAGAGSITDYAITYTVSGKDITDATLIGGIATTPGTASSGTIIETLINGTTGALIGTLQVSSGGPATDSISFAGVTSIIVQKDISLVGGTGSASVSIIDQGFSANAIPEPHSMALLGIGLASFFSFRRFLKNRAGVA